MKVLIYPLLSKPYQSWYIDVIDSMGAGGLKDPQLSTVLTPTCLIFTKIASLDQVIVMGNCTADGVDILKNEKNMGIRIFGK